MSCSGFGLLAMCAPLLCEVYLHCLLFTGVRGREILRSSNAGSCIELALRGTRMASEATTPREEVLYV